MNNILDNQIYIDFHNVYDNALKLKDLSIKLDNEGEYLVNNYANQIRWEGDAALKFRIRIYRYGYRMKATALRIRTISVILIKICDTLFVAERKAKGLYDSRNGGFGR